MEAHLTSDEEAALTLVWARDEICCRPEWQACADDLSQCGCRRDAKPLLAALRQARAEAQAQEREACVDRFLTRIAAYGDLRITDTIKADLAAAIRSQP